jgi:hypothetical protein
LTKEGGNDLRSARTGMRAERISNPQDRSRARWESSPLSLRDSMVLGRDYFVASIDLLCQATIPAQNLVLWPTRMDELE